MGEIIVYNDISSELRESDTENNIQAHTEQLNDQDISDFYN